MRAERLVLRLRCTLPRLGASGTGNLGRERLAIRPNRPILKIFLLPDGHGPLERVDQPMAGVSPAESTAPPLTGGNKATSSPDFSFASTLTYSWFTDTAMEVTKSRMRGIRSS